MPRSLIQRLRQILHMFNRVAFKLGLLGSRYTYTKLE
jgi:hypothetical protein